MLSPAMPRGFSPRIASDRNKDKTNPGARKRNPGSSLGRYGVNILESYATSNAWQMMSATESHRLFFAEDRACTSYFAEFFLC